MSWGSHNKALQPGSHKRGHCHPVLGLEGETQGWAGLAPPKPLCWACRGRLLPVPSCGRPSVHVCVLTFSGENTRVLWDQGHPMALTLIPSVQNPPPNTVTLRGASGQDPSTSL